MEVTQRQKETEARAATLEVKSESICDSGLFLDEKPARSNQENPGLERKSPGTRQG